MSGVHESSGSVSQPDDTIIQQNLDVQEETSTTASVSTKGTEGLASREVAEIVDDLTSVNLGAAMAMVGMEVSTPAAPLGHTHILKVTRPDQSQRIYSCI